MAGKKCPDCRGTGRCPHCGGTGKNKFGQKCIWCWKSSETKDQGQNLCSRCQGKGEV